MKDRVCGVRIGVGKDVWDDIECVSECDGVCGVVGDVDECGGERGSRVRGRVDDEFGVLNVERWVGECVWDCEFSFICCCCCSGGVWVCVRG